MDFVSIFKNSDNNLKISTSEILRYMGCNECGNEDLSSLLSLAKNAENEVKNALNNRAVWRYTKIKNIFGDTVDFGEFSLKSNSLAKHLENSLYASFMVATIGSQIDILIKKHSVLSMSYAVAINAAGASYIESYCDYVCDIINKQVGDYALTSRFSPGYGGLDLKCQEEIFSYLDVSKNTGVHLNESFMMMPSKSVCAIIGIGKNENGECHNKCMLCEKTECVFRKGN